MASEVVLVVGMQLVTLKEGHGLSSSWPVGRVLLCNPILCAKPEWSCE